MANAVYGAIIILSKRDLPADLMFALTDAVSMGTAASAIRRRSARAAFPVHDVFAFFFRVACFCSYSAAYKRGWSSCSLLPTPISDEFTETRKLFHLTRPLWRVVDELEQDERINEPYATHDFDEFPIPQSWPSTIISAGGTPVRVFSFT